MKDRKVMVSFGTRPEAIKLAPVYRALEAREGLDPELLVTGQHQEQLVQALSVFGLEAATDLGVMTARQRLPELVERILPRAARHLRETATDYVLVQGDTLSTFVVAWTAFIERIPVGHVEAGLRSHDLEEPFPEEANRRLTSVIADLHFAPTDCARSNLIDEGIDPAKILVTGQTGVDALIMASERARLPDGLPSDGPLVTVTLHRRENWPRLDALAGVIRRLAIRHPDVAFVYPVHLNPVVREAVWPILDGVPNVHLLDPIDYGAMVALLQRSRLIITDSGGLQEEGTALGVPVKVIRNVTERPEGQATGRLDVVGTTPERLLTLLSSALVLESRSAAPPTLESNPYGDGRAAERIAAAVSWRLGLGSRPAEWAGPALDGKAGRRPAIDEKLPIE